jgi:hypothetical protein
MPIDIRINIDLSMRQKRAMRAAVVAGVVIGSLGVGVALAMPPNSFKTGDKVSSKLINENFTNLDSRIAPLEAKVCGSTAPVTGAIGTSAVNGYKVAADLCAAVSGCGATAHMCTGAEITRDMSTGRINGAGYGWISSGAIFGATPGQGGDCAGYTVATNQLGIAFNALNAVAPACSTSIPVICCR